MKTLYFIHTGATISKAVKEETSLLSMHRKTENGETAMQELVMDEQYASQFKRLFELSHSEIIKNMSANVLGGTPTDIACMQREFPDFTQDRDSVLYLKVSDDFPMQYQKSIDIKIENYIVDYICYRWLEKRSPSDARTYFERLEPTLSDIKILLCRRNTPVKIKPSFP